MTDGVIFDLGGVLVEVGGVATMRLLAGIDSDDGFWQRWLACRWVRRFEQGGCSPEEFAAGVVADWSLPLRPEEFLEGFRDWLALPLPGAEELVREVAGRGPVVGCLSNTNAVHWGERMSRWPMAELFVHRFLSFELRLLKPDHEVFEHVAAEMGMPAERILFLDDNALNVEAASHLGFRAVQVRGVEEARQALRAAGVL